ncbi:MAG: hypothetical protein R2722_12050 [Tessaracoccus sp.]
MRRKRTPKVKPPKTMEQIAEAFRQVRDSQSDEDWAWSAAAQLDLDDVRPALTREALADLLPELREKKRSAHKLFGDPITWARTRQAAWHADGVLVTARPEPFSPSGFLHRTFSIAAIIAAALVVTQLVTNGWGFDFPWSFVALPPLIAAGILLILRMWNIVLQRDFRRFLICMVVLAIVIYGGGTFVVVGQSVISARMPGLLMLAVAAAYALVSRFIERNWLSPDADEPGIGSPTTS